MKCIFTVMVLILPFLVFSQTSTEVVFTNVKSDIKIKKSRNIETYNNIEELSENKNFILNEVNLYSNEYSPNKIYLNNIKGDVVVGFTKSYSTVVDHEFVRNYVIVMETNSSLEYLKEVFHHEMMHIIFDENFSMRRDENSNDFLKIYDFLDENSNYFGSREKSYEYYDSINRDKVKLYEHGYPSIYSTDSIEEEMCELYTHYFCNLESYQWAKKHKDSVLYSKFKFMISFINTLNVYK